MEKKRASNQFAILFIYLINIRKISNNKTVSLIKPE